MSLTSDIYSRAVSAAQDAQQQAQADAQAILTFVQQTAEEAPAPREVLAGVKDDCQQAANETGEIARGIQHAYADSGVDPYVQDGIVLAKTLVGFCLSSESKGTSIGVDQGDKPYRFDFGKTKDKLFEKDLVSANPDTSFDNPDEYGETGTGESEMAARFRVFGSHSAESLSASIGIETQTGWDDSAEWQDHIDRPSDHKIEHFCGEQDRAFVEVGIAGGSVGTDTFVGFERMQSDTSGKVGSSDNWNTTTTQLDIGLRNSMLVHAGLTGASAYVHEMAGIEGRLETQDMIPFVGPVGMMVTNEVHVLFGYEMTAKASENPVGASAGLDFFVGARASWKPSIGIAYKGAQILGLFANVEGRLGFGLTCQGSFGIDWKNHRVGFSGEAGAACGVGAAIGGGATIGADNDFGKDFDLA